MAGEEAHGIDPDAAVIVSAGSKTVVVSTIPTCGVDAAEYLAGLVHATAALLQRPKPDKASHTFTVASKPIHFFDLTGAPYSTVYGGIAIGDRLLTVRAVFPPALMTPGLDLLKRTLEGIELLDDAEISALAALLPQGTKLVSYAPGALCARATTSTSRTACAPIWATSRCCRRWTRKQKLPARRSCCCGLPQA